MKKSSVLLFVMSIISIIIAVIALCGAIGAAGLLGGLEGIQNSDDLTKVLGIFAFIGIAALLFIAASVAVITALPGILGILCSIKNGKFATGCLVIGSIGSFRSLIWLIDSILEKSETQDAYIFLALAAFVYFGLYTAGAAIVYKNKEPEPPPNDEFL